MPRRERGRWALYALAQALLIIAQAELLARTIAGLDSGMLPWLAGVVALRAVVTRAFGAAARRASIAVRQDLGGRLVRRADSRRRGGEFSTLLTQGLAALDPYLSGYLPQVVTAVVVPPLVLIRIGMADWISAVIVVAALPLIPVFGALIGLRTRELTDHRWQELQRLGGHFRDVLVGLSTLRVFGRTDHQALVIRDIAEGHRRATMGALRVAFLSSLVLELVCSITVALVAVPIGLRLIAGDVDLAPALVVLLLTPEALLPVRALGTRFHAAAEGMTVADEVRAVLADQSAGADEPATAVSVSAGSAGSGRLSPREDGAAAGAAGRVGVGDPVRFDDIDPPPADPPQPADRLRITASDRRRPDERRESDRDDPPEIRLEEVTVRFPGRDRPALDRVSLTIAPGERLAVVGPSGAGKSTLLHLLLGFVTPDEGRVLIDGVDLADQDIARWRGRIAWTPQQPHLFATSVADNIRLGSPEAGADQVRAAAATAEAAGFIEALPDGYDTVLGERGAGVSAGQRQRIALARAFLRAAPVVLLDEPTARLDLRSEAAVVTAAARLLADRTALLVAHRPALAGIADRVVTLTNGRAADGAATPRAEAATPRPGETAQAAGAGAETRRVETTGREPAPDSSDPDATGRDDRSPARIGGAEAGP
ncbi:MULTISPECIES: ABC transporter ATP-binding protein/permease [Actinoalloteichus]|uniref:ABC transporter n=1 Tax=Actinoalloteichus fjordicus TaxID=1612552 RepID=A0AAC9LFI6_9PSEU|nr:MULTISPECIES: ATP-binding cassette domain-containing protein [Actinoalloteichus]APU16677.1 ABC transporter [Actinoalloteichus fjordicus]APU22743.1 ABC transporter [Actinoalloteichus sp. GBA129-24]